MNVKWERDMGGIVLLLFVDVVGRGRPRHEDRVFWVSTNRKYVCASNANRVATSKLCPNIYETHALIWACQPRADLHQQFKFIHVYYIYCNAWHYIVYFFQFIYLNLKILYCIFITWMRGDEVEQLKFALSRSVYQYFETPIHLLRCMPRESPSYLVLYEQKLRVIGNETCHPFHVKLHPNQNLF